MGIFGKKDARKVTNTEPTEENRLYDYSTPEKRAETALWLFRQAQNERTGVEDKWQKATNYYEGKHPTTEQIAESMKEQGIPWTPACVPDPYVMVESQINPNVPQPQFHGRDETDGEKAKKREFAVKYILEANRIGDMNTSAERRLRKLGDCFWKVYWDEAMPCGDRNGNIRIRDVSPVNIFPDPVAGADGLQACEYVDYVYSMHKMRFWRVFGAEMEKLGVTLDEIAGEQEAREARTLLSEFTAGTQFLDDEVEILEHWYRTPTDEDGVPAGSIACSIIVAGREIRHIPNYWERTGAQNQLFPFVHSWCIRDENGFWNKGEIEPIMAMVDAADRELATAQLNDAFTANDIVVVEENAFVDGYEPENRPGAVWKMKPGRGNSVARLGGLQSGQRSVNTVSWLLQQVQRTNRNYDSNNGQEPVRVTTASGLLQMRSDAQTQAKIKENDRNTAFCRLFELCDWSALEFFDDNRLLYLGAEKEGEAPQTVQFNADEFAQRRADLFDPLTGELVQQGTEYFPTVDVTISAGDALNKSPAMTLEIIDKLTAVQPNKDNWRLLARELELLDIPDRQSIIEGWKAQFEPSELDAATAALAADPALLQAVLQMAQQGSAAGGAVQGMPMGAPIQTDADVLGAPAMPQGVEGFGAPTPQGAAMNMMQPGGSPMQY